MRARCERTLAELDVFAGRGRGRIYRVLPQGELHALCTLDGLGTLTPDDALHALRTAVLSLISASNVAAVREASAAAPDDKRGVILRTELDELRSTERSIMPEGIDN